MAALYLSCLKLVFPLSLTGAMSFSLSVRVDDITSPLALRWTRFEKSVTVGKVSVRSEGGGYILTMATGRCKQIKSLHGRYSLHVIIAENEEIQYMKNTCKMLKFCQSYIVTKL